MIKINKLTFAYSEKNEVLKNISFETEKQKVTALLGHNGAGKTTLFKCILGLLKPKSGSVEITLSEKGNCNEKIISYLPDSGGLYPFLSPLENLVFRASFYNNYSEAEQLAQFWLEKLKLNKSKVKYAGNLSHGMKKRLSFACALINNPNILLLDEPTNGLDPESIDTITNLISEVNKEDTTIIINTHDLNLVKESCYKIIILQDGSVIGEKKVKDIEENLKEYYLEMVDGYNNKTGEDHV